MRILCNVCELAVANVLCCADDAALCWACDEKVHAANKLASKHQRVPLTSSFSQMSKCDICQETVGYFFCLEDRALLCRKCDVSIHTANAYVSAHRRFLLTGVQVGLEPAKLGASSSSPGNHAGKKISEKKSHAVSRKNGSMSLTGQYNKILSRQADSNVAFVPTTLLSGGSAADSIPPWQLDEFFGINEFSQNCGNMNNGSFKADEAKLGATEAPLMLGSVEEEMDGNECPLQVPDAFWTVPEMFAPHTESGLHWPNDYQSQSDSTMFVPDVRTSPLQSHHQRQLNSCTIKRQRQF